MILISDHFLRWSSSLTRVTARFFCRFVFPPPIRESVETRECFRKQGGGGGGSKRRSPYFLTGRLRVRANHRSRKVNQGKTARGCTVRERRELSYSRVDCPETFYDRGTFIRSPTSTENPTRKSRDRWWSPFRRLARERRHSLISIYRGRSVIYKNRDSFWPSSRAVPLIAWIRNLSRHVQNRLPK